MTDQNELLFEIPSSWAGRALESFLRNELHLSRGQIRTLKRLNGIFINSQPVYCSHRLQGGEDLALFINPIEQKIVPEEIALSIIYEDVDLIVINKPAGMVVHPVGVYKSGTLANALVYYWQKNQQSASFHPLHRLDRLTSGLLLIAKNPWAHQQLARQIESGRFHRLYLAISHGRPVKNSGKISIPLKHSKIGFKWEVSEEGKPAITRFRALRKKSNACLLAVKLFTGRTHQIRVHLAYLGTPLWGDPIYGLTDLIFPRPALHAARLAFTHPRNNQRIKLTASLPEDFVFLLNRLEIG